MVFALSGRILSKVGVVPLFRGHVHRMPPHSVSGSVPRDPRHRKGNAPSEDHNGTRSRICSVVWLPR